MPVDASAARWSLGEKQPSGTSQSPMVLVRARTAGPTRPHDRSAPLRTTESAGVDSGRQPLTTIRQADLCGRPWSTRFRRCSTSCCRCWRLKGPFVVPRSVCGAWQAHRSPRCSPRGSARSPNTRCSTATALRKRGNVALATLEDDQDLGCPLLGIELAIRAPGGERCPDGELGEVSLRSPYCSIPSWAPTGARARRMGGTAPVMWAA